MVGAVKKNAGFEIQFFFHRPNPASEDNVSVSEAWKQCASELGQFHGVYNGKQSQRAAAKARICSDYMNTTSGRNEYASPKKKL